MLNNLTAQLTATMYVFGANLRSRREEGQTTAEYVGIVAFVAIIVVGLFTLTNLMNTSVRGLIRDAFTYIGDQAGFGG